MQRRPPRHAIQQSNPKKNKRTESDAEIMAMPMAMKTTPKQVYIAIVSVGVRIGRQTFIVC
jgi:hypothetical protein